MAKKKTTVVVARRPARRRPARRRPRNGTGPRARAGLCPVVNRRR